MDTFTTVVNTAWHFVIEGGGDGAAEMFLNRFNAIECCAEREPSTVHRQAAVPEYQPRAQNEDLPQPVVYWVALHFDNGR